MLLVYIYEGFCVCVHACMCVCVCVCVCVIDGEKEERISMKHCRYDPWIPS